jgi:hypothetical protein
VKILRDEELWIREKERKAKSDYCKSREMWRKKIVSRGLGAIKGSGKQRAEKIKK